MCNANERKVIFITIDFKKVYGIVNRTRLLVILVGYKMNPKNIYNVTKMYKGDSTVLQLGGMSERVKVTLGICQGCSGSTFSSR